MHAAAAAAAAAAKSLQSCPTVCNPIDGSAPGSSVPGILQARILERVAISFSNACMHPKSLQLCPTVQPHRRQSTRLPHPWDSLSKNTGVGCHFLFQCMKVKSQSEVTQLTGSDSMDCSLPGFSVHEIFLGKSTGVRCHCLLQKYGQWELKRNCWKEDEELEEMCFK